jgi:hypothetical protein
MSEPKSKRAHEVLDHSEKLTDNALLERCGHPPNDIQQLLTEHLGVALEEYQAFCESAREAKDLIHTGVFLAPFKIDAGEAVTSAIFSLSAIFELARAFVNPLEAFPDTPENHHENLEGSRYTVDEDPLAWFIDTAHSSWFVIPSTGSEEEEEEEEEEEGAKPLSNLERKVQGLAKNIKKTTGAACHILPRGSWLMLRYKEEGEW